VVGLNKREKKNKKKKSAGSQTALSFVEHASNRSRVYSLNPAGPHVQKIKAVMAF